MGILDFIFPKRCVGCGRIGRYICSSCRKLIVPIAPNECICPVCGKPAIAGITHPRCRSRYTPDGLTSFFYYKDTVKRAVKTIKYRFISDLAEEFTDLIPIMSYEIRSFIGNPGVVLLPIPLHPSRERFRGFNQSELLGIGIARRLRISMNTGILQRRLMKRPQVQMTTKNQRLANMRHAFEVKESAVKRSGDGKIMLLFDDVFTTGATIREAANALKRHGVKHVWAVTMAR